MVYAADAIEESEKADFVAIALSVCELDTLIAVE
jgi:hypothetical protein